MINQKLNKWKRYFVIAAPLFLSACLFTTYIALWNTNTPKKENKRIFESLKTEQRPVSPEADSLLALSNTYLRNGEFQKALVAVEKSLEINETLKNDRAIGNCLNRIATIHYYQGDFLKALSFFEQGIAAYERAEFTNGIATLINNKGAIYYYLGNFPRALEHYKRAAKLNESLNNRMQSATTIQNIGGIYVELEDFDQAMKHFEIAKKTYLDLDDTLSLSQISNSIGEVYLRKKSYEDALEYFQEALILANGIKAHQSILEVIYNLGDTYRKLGDYEKAMEYYHQAELSSEKLNNTLYQSLADIGIGTTLVNQGKLSEAIDYCRNGLNTSLDIQTVSVQRDACDCLYDAYKLTNQIALALQYLEQSIALKDSLQARQTADKLLNMEFEKKMILDSIAHVEKELRIEQEHQEVVRRNEKQRNIIIVVLAFIALVALGTWSRLNYVKKSKKRLQKEKDRSEHLLLNILPGEIADELKENGYVEAQDFETASILFTDFKSFTATASQLTPKELVQELNICFKAFDHIIEYHELEKIKTIGDAYMAAGGIPVPNENAVKNIIFAGLEMQEFIVERKRQNELLGKPSFEMRVGVHVGPIVAGIVGVKKFQYDIWGDTVNTASRMESNGEVGRVNISKQAYLMVKDEEELTFEFRGKINAKGKGDMEMYFVSRRDLIIQKQVPEYAYV